MQLKRIYSLILAVIMILALVGPVSAAGATSEVFLDLSASMLDGQKFDPSDFPQNTSDNKVYLLTVNERGFNSKDMSKYGFYVYLYNPSGVAIDVSSSYNKIELATSWDSESQIATDYSKFRLEFVSVSQEDGYEYLFYKFKVGKEVNGTKTIDQYLKPLGRFYDIGGFEVKKMTVTNALEYSVGMRYAYYGTEAAANKTCKASQIDTIELEVHHTYFRTESSTNGINHQNQLNAVYFNVPAEYWLSYDFLYAIKCYWEEYRTTPMIVSESSDLIAHLTTWRGRGNGDGYNSTNPVSLYSGLSKGGGSSGNSGTVYNYNWGYNVRNGIYGIDVYNVREYCNAISWAFYSDEIELRKSDVSSASVLQQWESNKSEWRDKMITEEGVNEYFSDRVAGPQTHTIYFDQTFTMESYASSHNWLQRLWNYNIFNGGAGTNLKDDYSGILAIEVVDTGHLGLRAEDLAKKYYVNPTDADNFKSVVDEGKKTGMKTVVFRFAVTDYFAEEINAEINGVKLQETTYRAEQTVFLDFDIISLTFQKEASLYTIPVSSSPSDFIGGINAPQVDKDASIGNAVDSVKDMFSELSVWKTILKVMGAVLGLILVLFVLYLIIGIVRPMNPIIVKINDTAKQTKRARQKYNKKKTNGGNT